jgi:hypothetical protein
MKILQVDMIDLSDEQCEKVVGGAGQELSESTGMTWGEIVVKPWGMTWGEISGTWGMTWGE